MAKSAMTIFFARFAVVLGLAITLGACGDDTDEGACPEGEVLAVVEGSSEEMCYARCSQPTDCAGTEQCRSGFCMARSNGGGNGNGGADAGNDNDSTSMTDTGEGGSELDILCTQLCDLLYGPECVQSTCPGMTMDQVSALGQQRDSCINGGASGGQTQMSCVERLEGNAEERAATEAFVARGCPAAREQFYCQVPLFYAECGCEMSELVGTACTMSDQCDSGEVDTFCIPETFTNPNTGMTVQTGFPGGLCSAVCDISVIENPQPGNASLNPATGCGGVRDVGTRTIGNLCQVERVQQGSDELAGTCLPSCVDNSECRTPEYSCEKFVFDSGAGTSIGTCRPACNADTDCISDVQRSGNMPASCDLAAMTGCADGFECIENPTAAGQGVCVVLGRCSAENYCERGCDPTAAMPDCGSGFQCEASATDPAKGYCVSP